MSMGFKRPKVRHLTRWNQHEWPPRLINLCDRPTRQETGKSWPDECMTDEFFVSLPICSKCLKISEDPDNTALVVLITPALPDREEKTPPANVKLTLNSYLNYGEGLGV